MSSFIPAFLAHRQIQQDKERRRREEAAVGRRPSVTLAQPWQPGVTPTNTYIASVVVLIGHPVARDEEGEK